MNDSRKTKAQLIEELGELRRRLEAVEPAAAGSARKTDGRSRSKASSPTGRHRSTPETTTGADPAEPVRVAVQNMAVMVDAFDEHGNIIFWNRECERITGYSAAEIVGNPAAMELLYPGADYRERMMAEWQARGDDFRSWDWSLTCKDGTRRIISWTNEAGRFPVPGWASWAVGTDVTEIRRAHELLRVQRDLGMALSAPGDPAEILDRLLAASLQINGIDCGAVYLVGEVGGELNLVAHRGLSEEYVGGASHNGPPPCEARRVLQGRSVYLDLPQLSAEDGRHLAEGIRALAIVPVWYEGKVVAALNVGSRTDGDIPAATRDALEAMATQIGSVLARAEAELAQRESEGRFRAVFETARDSIFIKDLDLKYVVVNPAMAELLGEPAERVTGRTDAELFERNAGPRSRETDARVLAGETVAEEQTRLVGGIAHTFHVIEVPLRGRCGEVVGLCGIARDITERKQTEASLRESEERYRAFFEQAADSVLVVDAGNGAILECNQRAHEHLGYSQTEFQGLGVQNIEALESADEVVAHIQRILEGDQAAFETKHRTKGGELRDVLVSARAISVNGRRCIQSICHDITGRKRMEEAMRRAHDELERRIAERTAELSVVNATLARQVTELEQAEKTIREDAEKLELFFRHTPAAIAVFDREMRYLHYSNRWLEEFGLEGQDLAGRSHYEVFPEVSSIPRWTTAHQRGLQGKVEKGNEDRFPRQDGRQDWVKWEVHPWHDAAGQVGGIIMFTEVITERKHVQEILRASEARYRAVVEDQTELICRFRPDGTLTFVNNACARYFGRPRSELLGRDFLSLMPEEERPALRARVAGFTEAGHAQTVEHRVRRPDGAMAWQQWTQRGFFDDQGQLLEVQAVGRDVTERRNAEEALRQSEQQYRGMFESQADAVLVIDPEGRIVDANPAACGAFQHAGEELSGRPLKELLHPDSHGLLPCSERVLQSEQLNPAEGVGLRKDGRAFDVEVRFSPYTYRGQPHVLTVVRDITRRRQAQEALRQSEHEKSLILSSVSEVVSYQDRDLHILWANRAAGESTGTAPAALVGRHCYEIWSGRTEPCPDCPVLRAVDTGEPQQGEMCTPDGRVWQVRGYPVRDPGGAVTGVVEVTQDITARKRAEETLQRERDFTAAVLDTAGALIAVVDTRGRVVRFNRACEQTTGYSAGEVLGKRFWELFIPDEQREDTRAAFDRLCQGELPAGYETHLVTRDGQRRLIAWSNTLLHDRPSRLKHAVCIGIDITASRAAEQTLRRREELYRLLTENTTDVITRHAPDGTSLYVSPACRAVFGYGPEELIGRHPAELIHEEDRAAAEAAFGTVSSCPDETTLVYRCRRADGSYVWVETKGRLVRDPATEQPAELICVIRDISDRKRAEMALRENEERLRSLFEATFEAVAIHDAGVLLDVNAAFEELLGCRLPEAQGKSLLDFMAPDYRELVAGRMSDGRPDSFEAQALTAAGDVLDVEVVCKPHRHRGRAASVTVLRDITERKRAEDALRRADRLAALGTVVAGVAHELNNPLTAVSGLAELLAKNGSLRQGARQAADEIVVQAMRCRNIVQDLLGFARARRVSRQVVQINTVLKRCLDLSRRTRRFDDVEFIEEYDSELPEIPADPYRLEQVFINVIRNAGDALTEVESAKRLLLRTFRRDQHIHIEFQDSGPGIADPGKVFDPFYTTRITAEATGLGLSVSLGIVRDHGGTFTAENTDQGARFVVTLPIHRVTPGSREARPRGAGPAEV